ncbi:MULTISPECIES: tyrosine-type recombinase/integrase [Sodalis]|uniref:Integrase n=1 Tax=Sodalis ligni TaxID=2697027 RepID=A0A4R1N4U8_9GAMM|nr:integrase arm-type DNA-binding domain-containing protein [Sodalis ligni]TCL02214.1 integrase [Sodalis ligni]
MPLTDTTLRYAKPRSTVYKLTDTQGLYLLVKPNGSKLWQLKYRYAGKEKKLSFGAYPAVSLVQARQQRDSARRLLSQDTDPALIRSREKQAKKMGFMLEDVARQWHQSNRTWSEDHAKRILRSLEIYLFPVLGRRNITTIETIDLLHVVQAVERKGFSEVALRLQQRLTTIMRFAVQHQIIKYNPALDLAGVVSTPPMQHRPALPLTSVPDFFSRLSNDKGRKLTQLALRLNFYVFIRSSELRFARWKEIDFDNAVWVIPARRDPLPGVRFSHRGTKMKTPHLIPLSHQSLALLKEIEQITGHLPILFPNDHDPNKTMSENTLNKILQRLGYDTKQDVCVHGFRAMACSALLESGKWSREAIELQMSHQERNSIRAAYSHLAEHLEVRKLMMQWWADYLDANQNNYVAPYCFYSK